VTDRRGKDTLDFIRFELLQRGETVEIILRELRRLKELRAFGFLSVDADV
jgi:hypothetical protein